MNKKGLSGGTILQIGLLAIAAFTTLLGANLFYDSVESAVYGDPYIAVKTMSSYVDFMDASPMPMTIYHEIPQDLAGNPGYGTVLFDPINCEFKVNKFPQDYITDVITNHAWDTITFEDALTVGALQKFRTSKTATKLAAAHASANWVDVDGNPTKLNKKFNTKYNKQLQKSLQRQGYPIEELARQTGRDAGSLMSERTVYGQKVYNAHANEEIFRALGEAGVPENKIHNIDFVATTSLVKQGDFLSRTATRLAEKKAVTTLGKVALFSGRTAVGVARIAQLPIKAVAWATEKTIIAAKSVVKLMIKVVLLPFKLALQGISRLIPAKVAANVVLKFAETKGPIGAAGAAIAAGGIIIADYVLTYYPIYHLISKSQDATNEVNKYWASNSCIARPEKVVVSKPNCKSEPVLIYPDLESGWLNSIGLGFVNAPITVIESALAMPSSQPTNELKEYDSIENDGELCVDYHNALLAKDAGLFGWDTKDKIFGIPIGKVNPREVFLTAPFAYCITQIYRPSWASGCNILYSVAYLSFWAAPAYDDRNPNNILETSAGAVLMSSIGATALAGPDAAVRYGALVGIGTVSNPLSSKTFFPTISQSAGMIDTDKYYYMEDPFVISLSKELKDGEYVFEISKER